MITYEEFVHKFMSAIMTPPSDLRIGQIFFNTLMVHNPELAEKIRASRIDPFHKDRVSEDVWSFVMDNWQK